MSSEQLVVCAGYTRPLTSFAYGAIIEIALLASRASCDGADEALTQTSGTSPDATVRPKMDVVSHMDVASQPVCDVQKDGCSVATDRSGQLLGEEHGSSLSFFLCATFRKMDVAWQLTCHLEKQPVCFSNEP